MQDECLDTNANDRSDGGNVESDRDDTDSRDSEEGEGNLEVSGVARRPSPHSAVAEHMDAWDVVGAEHGTEAFSYYLRKVTLALMRVSGHWSGWPLGGHP